jgi:hypothetical protein
MKPRGSLAARQKNRGTVTRLSSYDGGLVLVLGHGRTILWVTTADTNSSHQFILDVDCHMRNSSDEDSSDEDKHCRPALLTKSRSGKMLSLENRM